MIGIQEAVGHGFVALEYYRSYGGVHVMYTKWFLLFHLHLGDFGLNHISV